MDRFLDNQNLESIRKTMQAQEETFKHQVRELHRVHSTQKIMMEEMKKQRRHGTNNLTIFLQPTASYHKDNKSWRESCSSIDHERPAREISAVDLGRWPTRTNGSDVLEESQLELTLSIGVSSSSTTRDMDSSTTSFRSDNCSINNGNSNNNHNQESSSSSTTLDQEKKKPHWLFQGLSINRT